MQTPKLRAIALSETDSSLEVCTQVFLKKILKHDCSSGRTRILRGQNLGERLVRGSS